MEWVDVGGAKLEVARVGHRRPGRPSILLLHEGLGSVSLWKDFPKLLAEVVDTEVVAYSRRGYGASDPRPLPWPVTYMHDEAELLPELLAALGIDEVVGFGHSDGASIAIIAAGKGTFPGLRGLVLESPHVFTEPWGLAEIRRAGAAYRETNLRERLARHHGRVDVAFFGWHDAWTHPDFENWNLEAYLPGIDIPILLVQEEGDPYGTLAQLDAIETRVRGPVERLVLPGEGHSPHRDHRDAVLEAVARFVAGL